MKPDPDAVYRCAACGAIKPLTEEHWYFDHGERRHGACRECKRAKQRAYGAANRELVNRRKREQHARDMANQRKRARKRRQWRAANRRRQASEEGREQLRRAARKYRAKIMADPARRAAWNEAHREISRRYFAKLKADPKRYAAYLAYKRGERSTTVPDPAFSRGGGLVPVGPLRAIMLAWLERTAAERGTSAERGRRGKVGALDALASTTGVTVRTLRAIKSGERREVSVDAADRICIALGAHLIDVYPELYEFDDEREAA